MAILRFVTHPQVRISADIPVPRWGLNEVGRARAEALTRQPWLANATRLISSGETKALETAAIVACATGRPIEIREELHENDRSSTGFVSPDRFETLADAFFANPDTSVEGWETARGAQHRIVQATADLTAHTNNTIDEGDILVIGHGAVGTLLLCELLCIPITRVEDQVGGEAAPGGGNYWSYDRTTQTCLHRWRPIDLDR